MTSDHPMGLKKAFRNKNIRSIIADSWSVSWPMTLIMGLIFIIGLCDVYVAGRFGKEVQAAYGLAFQMYFIFSIIASALSVGTVSVVARLFTPESFDDNRDAVDTSLILSVLAGLICGAAGWAIARPLINSFSLPDQLKETSVILLRLYSIGLPFNYIFLNSNGIMRACGMIRRSLVTMALVCALNLVLILYLALHTPLGFRGIGIATVISTAAGMCVNLVFLRPATARRIRFSPQAARRIVSIGWPAGVLQVLWNTGSLALFFIVSRLPQNNVEVMAALTNGLRIESAIFLPAFAFNMSNAVVVGNLIGKRKSDDAFAGGIVTGFLGVGVVVVLTLLVLANARLIAGFLSSNPVVVDECARYIYISLILEPLMAWGVILGGGLNGAGDTRSVMLIIEVSMWFVRIPLAYAMGIGMGWGAPAIWWSMNASIIVQTAFITRRYFAKKWLIAE